MDEREHILKVLKEVRKALAKGNAVKIKKLSNKIIHSASIQQEQTIVLTAVLIYSLSKILEREDYRMQKNWDFFYESYIGYLDEAIKELKENNLEGFYLNIKSMQKLINQLSGKLKFYIQDVFRRAKINKASRLYEHGISMEKTAKILGISIWELAEYAGQTGIHDVNLAVTMPLKERIKLAEEIFK